MSDSETNDVSQPEDTEVRTRTRSRARRAPAQPAADGAHPPVDEAPATGTPFDAAALDAEDGPVRRKTRSRRPAAGEGAVDPKPARPKRAPRSKAARPQPDVQEPEGPSAETEARVAGDVGEVADTEQEPAEPRRRRTRRVERVEGDEPADEGADEVEDDLADADEGAEADGGAEDETADGAPRADGSRRRRRGGRGRGRRGGRARARTGDEATAEDDDEAPQDLDDDEGAEEASADDEPAPTRLQARSRGGRSASTRTSARGRGRTSTAPGRGRRPLGGVSEETRRAINEGPPRRMLVTEGEQRTQIAVLEERTLVEHYVTRREDISYVGNIYLGRIQNVLPGMEAAFVDIGKGRNGVLYAGEVNYDEADLEGELPRIEQTLKSGQTVLVQVTKDPMGTKGARLTQHLSIAGRYCVIAPDDGMLGISRKLTDDERERLRKVLKGLRPEGYGLIVRTAAEGATAEQLEADINRLVRIWDEVKVRAEKAKALEPVYEEPNLVIRVIRDVFGTEYSDLIVDNEELASQIRDYLGDVSPDFVDKVTAHTGQDHIFDAYEVTNQIRRALEKKVWLKSGGYLIIEKTEAMWVIDVNTGKFVGERNLEETVLRNNIEAATEIARQLRLRDMGGIIVIDFVDMLLPANREEVLKRFKRELARDKTKSRVMEISKLGLVQMTRKNVSQGLQESFTKTCDACEGRGAKIVDHMLH